jgi:hypothetical protein
MSAHSKKVIPFISDIRGLSNFIRVHSSRSRGIRGLDPLQSLELAFHRNALQNVRR